ALTGHTFESPSERTTFDRRGFVVGESWGVFDVGRWEVTDDGEYCRTWNMWDGARRRCHRVYQNAEGLEFHAVDRWTVTKARRVSTP
ncbi:MAG: hypothetical protein ACREOC_19215, partial [Gemmatimonadales bacterium]